METKIKETLIRLLEAINRSDGAETLAQMDRLDALVAEARGTLHPQLAHFLERRSYAKAAMFLDGVADIPAGLCGGRAGQPPRGGAS